MHLFFLTLKNYVPLYFILSLEFLEPEKTEEEKEEGKWYYTVGRTQGTRTTRSTDYLHLSPVKVIPGTYYHVAVLFLQLNCLSNMLFPSHS